jgi:hypothetical protein
MRNIGLVSAAVIAMAAMAGTVAASALPVIQIPTYDPNRQPPEQNITMELYLVGQEAPVSELLFNGVRAADEAGLSGEAAQQLIKGYVERYVEEITHGGPNIRGLRGRPLALLTLAHTQRVLINRNQLGRGSDGDLAISAMLAEREAGSRAEQTGGSRPSRGGYDRGGGGEMLRPRQAPAAGPSSPTADDAGRNLPGNEAAGQPATDAATTEVQQSQTTDDSDLDDEAGEPD